jgi:hypothetical protein
MGKINWARVLLCGLLTGAVFYLLRLLVFLFILRETEFARAVEAAGRPVIAALPFILSLAIGIWTMWLYAAIRPRYGPGPKTAALAGCALWVVAALAVAHWASVRLLAVPAGALVAPLAAGLPVAVLAVVVGAWPYKE